MKLVRIKIQKSKRNSDFYEVKGGGHKMVRTMSMNRAQEIAQARARLALKKGRTVKINKRY